MDCESRTENEVALCESREVVLDHLGYEWWMFESTGLMLSALPDGPGPVRNALLESLVIHGRQLIDFFYSASKPLSDDWTVDMLGHGLSRQRIPPDLMAWRTDANKRIAHMTASRRSPLAEWDIQSIAQHLESRMEEVRRAMGDDFPAVWSGNAPRISSLLLATDVLRASFGSTMAGAPPNV